MAKFRVGIIGCGNIFPMHAVSIQQSGLAEVVAICDIKEDRVRRWADVYNCAAYTDYQEMIDKADLDVVHICTPHYLHAPMVIYAANAGKHIMTEKPMSISIEEAEQMIEACDKNKVTFGVIFQNRYNPGSLLIKEALDKFELGHILGGIRRGDMASRIAQLHVIDILFTALLSSNFSQYIPQLELSYQMVQKYRKKR